MKRMAVLAGALALAGCGSENTGTVETPEGRVQYTASVDGSDTDMVINSPEGEVRIVSGADQKIDLPAGFTLYPGASVVTSSTVSHAEGSGVRVAMTSAASPLQVVDFYRKQARAAGITDLTEITGGGQVTIAGRGEDGTDFSLAATSGEGATSINLMVAKGF